MTQLLHPQPDPSSDASSRPDWEGRQSGFVSQQACHAKNPTWAERLGYTLFKRLLARFTEGQLTWILPDGQSETFGATFFEGHSATQQSPSYMATMVIHDWSFFKALLLYNDIGFAESYIRGEWESPDLFAVIAWFIANVDRSPELSGSTHRAFFLNLAKGVNQLYHWCRHNSVANSKQNIAAHYDLSNDFFSLFLDPGMTYSAALFDPDTPKIFEFLEQAQNNKYAQLAKGLKLRAQDRVLEIGTGWGGFACFAAKTYGCKITTITLSQKQYDWAKVRIVQEQLTDKIDLQLMDYRDVVNRYGKGTFDKVASIEMIEAVGDQYYEAYFNTMTQALNKNGLIGIQMILCADSRYKLLKDNVDFIQKHIFPGSLLPSLARIQQAMQKTGRFHLHELRDMGLDYATTLRLWDERFCQQLEAVRVQGFDDSFIRKWHYYLKYCEAAFATRNITVAQGIYTQPNNAQLL